MTADQIGALVGAVAGSVSMSTVVTWALLKRHLGRDLAPEKVEDSRGSVRSGGRNGTIDYRLGALEKSVNEVNAELKEFRKALGSYVTDEEFFAYSHQTTRATKELVEKVGTLTGRLDSWLESRRTST